MKVVVKWHSKHTTKDVSDAVSDTKFCNKPEFSSFEVLVDLHKETIRWKQRTRQTPFRTPSTQTRLDCRSQDRQESLASFKAALRSQNAPAGMGLLSRQSEFNIQIKFKETISRHLKPVKGLVADIMIS
jgi:hypothetical protein